jgi:hypothetical protein
MDYPARKEALVNSRGVTSQFQIYNSERYSLVRRIYDRSQGSFCRRRIIDDRHDRLFGALFPVVLKTFLAPRLIRSPQEFVAAFAGFRINTSPVGVMTFLKNGLLVGMGA